MAIGLFNPKDNVGATSVRPAHENQGAGVRRWLTDAGGGTRVHAQDINAIVAQFRAAMDALGIADSEGDDTVLTQLLGSVWTPGGNFIRNPSFDLWQAGTSFEGVTYIADMWKTSTNGNRVRSRQPGFSGARWCLRQKRTAGNSSTAALTYAHVLSAELAAALAGKQVTVSLDARCGADFAGSGINVMIVTGTGVEETYDAPTSSFPTGSAQANGSVRALSTSAQRLTYGPYTIPANATEIAVRISAAHAAAAAGADDWTEVTNVKLEIGVKASPFVPEPLALTLLAAMRHYQKSFVTATAPAQNAGSGTGERRFPATVAGANANRLGMVQFPVPMRAAPSVTFYNPAAANGQVRDLTAAADCSGTAAANITEKGFAIGCTGNAATAVGNDLAVHWVADGRTF